jgi:hypothetical protein
MNLKGHPLSRTYGVILQSSLTTILPSALVYSTHLPVSVLVRLHAHLEDFLGRPSDDFPIVIAVGPEPCVTEADLPTSRLSSVHGHFQSYRSSSGRRPPIGIKQWQRRNINLPSIVYAFRPRLRDRLTLGGFTFPRKP